MYRENLNLNEIFIKTFRMLLDQRDTLYYTLSSLLTTLFTWIWIQESLLRGSEGGKTQQAERSRKGRV